MAVKRILMTADTIGGVWTYALELARALEQFEVEIHLATLGAPLSPDQEYEVSRVPNVVVYPSTFRLEWMQDPWDDVARSGEWLLKLRDEIQPDLVHLNTYAHGALAWGVPVIMVAHSCVLSWWRAVKQEEAPPEWDRYREVVNAGLHGADLVAAPTRAMLRAIEQNYGAFANSRVIPNACDASAFAPVEKEPFVFAAGRLWDEAKNIAALDGIAAQVPWSVWVAGDTTDPDGTARGTLHVESLGRLSRKELAAVYSRASIYAFPARYEPFGLSILEAALSGCALVLGDIDSLRENWDGAALFVDPESSQALRAAVLRLISNDGERASLAQAAQQRASMFTPEKMAREYWNAYQSVAVEQACA